MEQNQKQNHPQTLSALLTNTCKYCKNPVSENFYFCPTCGKKLKEPPFKLSLGKAILVILESIVLPPFGLLPGFKYLFNKNDKAKILGFAAILLTIISTFFLIYLTIRIINDTNNTLNNIYKTQDLFNNPGDTSDQNNNLERIRTLQELGY